MNFYQELTFVSNAEVNLGFIWEKVFQQLHITLVENKIGVNESAIGFSFVSYGVHQFPLGNKLRLFANSENELVKLDIHECLKRLNDYCHVGFIKPVPADIKQYALFKRKIVKTIKSKAKRKAKYLNKPYDEVLSSLLKDGEPIKKKLPYINVESLSTKKRFDQNVSYPFLLFIEQTLFDSPQDGSFDCYGLSKTATVPWF